MEASSAVTTKNSDQLKHCMSDKNQQFIFSVKHVEVMRQTQTSIDNVLEHTLNDYWNGESDVAQSEDWKRRHSQIGRSSTQKDTHGKMVYPQKVRHTHDPTRSGSRNGEDDQ